jgi:hypothetical protein
MALKATRITGPLSPPMNLNAALKTAANHPRKARVGHPANLKCAGGRSKQRPYKHRLLKSDGG